mmetsp:Transcript_34091/g.96634  ORF Transcript_34091/g.96634 Transcript_34091/m.96634 type:complete len:367 (+) Transcript_34091:973-2073(+)
MIHCHTLGLVQWHQRAVQKVLMLLLQRQGKPVNNGTQNLQQLSDAVVTLRLVDEAVEDVVHRLADKRAVHHELAVYTVEDGLQVVALAGVLRVKQLQQPNHKVLVNVLAGDLGVRVVGNHVAKQELVHDLQVRPSKFKERLLLFRVIILCVATMASRRRERAEQVGAKHEYYVLADRLAEFSLPGIHVLHKLQQRLPLELLFPHMRGGVREVKREGAEMQLLHKQELLLGVWHVTEARQHVCVNPHEVLLGEGRQRRLLQGLRGAIAGSWLLLTPSSPSNVGAWPLPGAGVLRLTVARALFLSSRPPGARKLLLHALEHIDSSSSLPRAQRFQGENFFPPHRAKPTRQARGECGRHSGQARGWGER